MTDAEARKVIEAAAQWWKAAIAHSGAAPFSEPGASTGLNDLMSTALWSEYQSGKLVTMLVVDYEPLHLLDTSARAAGVHPADFPRNTTMDIRWLTGKAIVSVGRGNPFIQVFPTMQD